MLAAPFVLMLLPTAAYSQAFVAEDWLQGPTEGGARSFEHKSGRGVIVLAGITPPPGGGVDDVLRMTARDVDKPDVCGGASSRAPQVVDDIAGAKVVLADGQKRCTILGLPSPSGAVVVIMSVEDRDANLGGRALVKDLALGMSKEWAATRPQSGAVSPSAQARVTGTDDTALKSYLAAIPASRRPVYVATKGVSGFSGWPAMPTYSIRVYLFFSNGYATDCSDWNPALYDPTPESLGQADSDCDFYRWRGTPGALQLQSDDGSWSGSGLADDHIKFRAGERINISFGNIAATGFNAGSISTGTISGGDLVMRSDGAFASGDWSSTNISGGNVAGYSGSRTKGAVGRYYLDGHLIAVADENGQISAGFISGVRSKGALGNIYLNGTHYWEGDE